MSSIFLTGTVHGTAIELDRPCGLAEGQRVTVEVHPAKSGDGIRESAGAWAAEADAVDCWLEQIYEARQASRGLPQA